MRGLQVVEVDVYPYKNKNDRIKLMRKLGLKSNEITIKDNLIIVTREKLERSYKKRVAEATKK